MSTRSCLAGSEVTTAGELTLSSRSNDLEEDTGDGYEFLLIVASDRPGGD